MGKMKDEKVVEEIKDSKRRRDVKRMSKEKKEEKVCTSADVSPRVVKKSVDKIEVQQAIDLVSNTSKHPSEADKNQDENISQFEFNSDDCMSHSISDNAATTNITPIITPSATPKPDLVPADPCNI